jgi:hypothetical protein
LLWVIRVTRKSYGVFIKHKKKQYVLTSTITCPYKTKIIKHTSAHLLRIKNTFDFTE